VIEAPELYLPNGRVVKQGLLIDPGMGRHSRGQVSVLRPAVWSFLQESLGLEVKSQGTRFHISGEAWEAWLSKKWMPGVRGTFLELQVQPFRSLHPCSCPSEIGECQRTTAEERDAMTCGVPYPNGASIGKKPSICPSPTNCPGPCWSFWRGVHYTQHTGCLQECHKCHDSRHVTKEFIDEHVKRAKTARRRARRQARS
jgi:hypothetical protein